MRGDWEGRYRSQWGAVCGTAVSAQRNGWTVHEYLDTAHELGARAALRDRKPRAAAVKVLLKGWKAAERLTAAPASAPDPFQTRRTVAQLRECAERAQWAGQAGNADRLVLQAALELADERRSARLALSVRDLAERSGRSKSAAARALKRLTAAGWLRLEIRSTDALAAVYALPEDPSQSAAGIGTQVGHVGTSLRETDVSHLGPYPDRELAHLARMDAFAARALGPSAARVLAALDDLEGLSAPELARHLGLTARTCRRALESLEACGMVNRARRNGRTWQWTACTAAIAQEAPYVALLAGTAGRAASMRELHRRERACYVDTVQQLTERRRSRYWQAPRRPRAASMREHGLSRARVTA